MQLVFRENTDLGISYVVARMPSARSKSRDTLGRKMLLCPETSQTPVVGPADATCVETSACSPTLSSTRVDAAVFGQNTQASESNHMRHSSGSHNRVASIASLIFLNLR